MENWLDGCRGWERQDHYTPARQRIEQEFQNDTGHQFSRIPSTSRVLANRIHGSTRGLSTPIGAREKIASIQRTLIYDSSLEWLSRVSGKEIKWRSTVKLFSLLKIPTLAVGFGALLFFAPTCKAQSEVSPDHFDGTDGWEIAARKQVAAKAKPTPAAGLYQAQSKKTGSGASLQLASARELSKSTPHNAVALQDKRKVAARKSDEK